MSREDQALAQACTADSTSLAVALSDDAAAGRGAAATVAGTAGGGASGCVLGGGAAGTGAGGFMAAGLGNAGGGFVATVAGAVATWVAALDCVLAALTLNSSRINASLGTTAALLASSCKALL